MKYLIKTKNFLILVLILCISCNNNSKVEQEIKTMIGRQITFPAGYKEYINNENTNLNTALNADYKVVSYVSNIPCTECGINMICEWSKQIADLKIPYIIVVNSDNQKIFDEVISTNKIGACLIYYSTDIFEENNKLNVLARNKTFMLNKTNQIVVVGDSIVL